jgi:PIN domain nuclease of toxin-antitoxin system
VTENEPGAEHEQRAPEHAVLDASALLALLFEEPGGQEVQARLDGSILSSINLAEVLTRVRAEANEASAVEETIDTLDELGIHLEPVFTSSHAATAAHLQHAAHHLGLSLADRACLAITSDNPAERYALTADTAWTKLPAALGITVVAIR